MLLSEPLGNGAGGKTGGYFWQLSIIEGSYIDYLADTLLNSHFSLSYCSLYYLLKNSDVNALMVSLTV